MKKIIIFLTFLFACLILSACNTQEEMPSESTTTDTGAVTDNSQNGNSDPPPAKIISVRSVEELEEMKQMLEIKDGALFSQYLRSIESSGAINKEDLVAFVNMADKVPYVKLVDGEISWMSYSAGVSRDTGEEYEIFYITTKKSENEWCRIEYHLDIKELSSLLYEGDTRLSSTVKGNDGRIEIFTENKRDENVIHWIVKIDDLYARIVYKTNDSSLVNAQNIFSESLVSQLPAPKS